MQNQGGAVAWCATLTVCNALPSLPSRVGTLRGSPSCPTRRGVFHVQVVGTQCIAKETRRHHDRADGAGRYPRAGGHREPGAERVRRPPAQERWQAFWEADQTFVPADDGSAERRYVLDMFPYPSGDLHMGHAEAFVMGDVVARYLRLKGYDVLHPIGWDSFGLPAENAAIERNAHPAEWTYANIETQATSFRRYGLSFDWSRRLHTSDPEYYRWTQWLFLRFRERGLAYRRASYVNWCPKDQTVLANEQVIAGCASAAARWSPSDS